MATSTQTRKLTPQSAVFRVMKTKLRLYWKLIKSLQTGLLLATGMAGFVSFACPVTNFSTLAALAGSLFLAISGSTVLNMVYDRDIDARMGRTTGRPIPSGQISPRAGLILGLGLSIAGLAWGLFIQPLFGLVVIAGLFFDMVVYTMWLKRRTPWSIIWGGISGGMPVLAGRVLAVGEIDAVGLLLALGVLCWIPTHIMTFNMRYFDDYKRAGVPTFPSEFGFGVTRLIIALASVLAAGSFGYAAFLIGLDWGYLRLLSVLSVGMFFLAGVSLIKPSEKVNFGLFKYASLYMLNTMLLILLQAI
jgi:protoheme IX farnesyltransferase